MKPEDLQRSFIGITRTVAETMNRDGSGKTKQYIMDCLTRFFRGDFGTVPAEDTAANLEELETSEGRALARYPQKHGLINDIYINGYFSVSNPGNVDYNNTVVMYVDEY